MRDLALIRAEVRKKLGIPMGLGYEPEWVNAARRGRSLPQIALDIHGYVMGSNTDVDKANVVTDVEVLIYKVRHWRTPLRMVTKPFDDAVYALLKKTIDECIWHFPDLVREALEKSALEKKE